mgnify:FL=1
MMQTVSSQTVQTKFRQFSDLVKKNRDRPVIITQSQQPIMLVFAYEEGLEMMKLVAKWRFIRRLQQQADTLPEPTEAEMKAIMQTIEDEREAIYQKINGEADTSASE